MIHRFRWVVCQLDTLRTCLKRSAVLKALRQLPKTLDETYDRILLAIPEEYHHDAQIIFTLLIFSGRPISLAEAAEALAIDLEQKSFDPSNRLRETLAVSSKSIQASSCSLHLNQKCTDGGPQCSPRKTRIKNYDLPITQSKNIYSRNEFLCPPFKSKTISHMILLPSCVSYTSFHFVAYFTGKRYSNYCHFFSTLHNNGMGMSRLRNLTLPLLSCYRNYSSR